MNSPSICSVTTMRGSVASRESTQWINYYAQAGGLTMYIDSSESYISHHLKEAIDVTVYYIHHSKKCLNQTSFANRLDDYGS